MQGLTKARGEVTSVAGGSVKASRRGEGLGHRGNEPPGIQEGWEGVAWMARFIFGVVARRVWGRRALLSASGKEERRRVFRWGRELILPEGQFDEGGKVAVLFDAVIDGREARLGVKVVSRQFCYGLEGGVTFISEETIRQHMKDVGLEAEALPFSKLFSEAIDSRELQGRWVGGYNMSENEPRLIERLCLDLNYKQVSA